MPASPAPPRGLPLLLPLALCVLGARAQLGSRAPCAEELARLGRENERLAAEHKRLADENERLAAEVARLEARIVSEPPDVPVKVGSPAFIKCASMAFVCVVLAALAAGLTMGMLSLEPMEMEIIVKSEEKDMTHERDRAKLKADQAAAEAILPLIKNRHRLLVTLLLMNSIANEALPLFLDALVPSWMAVILSVTLVLMFGEIIPSAVFTGSEQLRIAAKFASMVTFFRFILAPIAAPIARVLDVLLGEDHKGRYNFAELRAIVGIHAKLHHGPQQVAFKHHDEQGLGIITSETPHQFTDTSIVTFNGRSTKLLSDGTLYYVKPCTPLKGRDMSNTFKIFSSEARHPADVIVFEAEGDLEAGTFNQEERDELKIMHGVMNLTHMQAKDAMVPLSKAWMLEGRQRITQGLLQEILESGFSRIPVYSIHKHNIRGFFLTKKLIVVSPDDDSGKGRCIESLDLHSMVIVPPTILMLDLLNKFQEDRCHIALVTNMPEQVREAWENDVVIPPDVHMAGIITLEDVIEKLLQEDIEDEHDARKLTTVRSQMFEGNRALVRRHSDFTGSQRLSTLHEPLLPQPMSAVAIVPT